MRRGRSHATSIFQSGQLIQRPIGINGKNAKKPEEMQNRTALLRRLRVIHADHPEYPVLIAGDRESKYDDVIQLISEAKKMGISRVGLATK